ncbi:MAG: threonine--tRNA ligase [Spirochaetales bacterium]|nr:threonine--tRNA ligase [Spirochaetales bacterium]
MAVTETAQKRLEADESLFKKRHSLAHIMAEAVLEVFPDAQIAIGPPVDNGFYYDFGLPRPLTEADFPVIEDKMRQIIRTRSPFVREVVTKSEAAAVFTGQTYKLAILKDLNENEEISLYRSHNFVDLCRGPHVEDTSRLDPSSFKLAKVAGAYWKGDEKSPMLQRLYAYAFHSRKDLEAYLKQLEEAEKRDHRRLGKELDLFHLDAENPGQIYWHPAGWAVWRVIEDYIREKIRLAGYQEIKTPSVMPQSLWERSGHWAKYKDNMFVSESEKRLFALKPMNCPGHIEVFKQGLKSYRDLPLRLAEFGSCTRNEASGALHGILRVRGFVQDDAHIFCTEAQIESEVKGFCDLLRNVYQDFGFQGESILVRLALRPDLRLGDDATWDKAETALGNACRAAGFDYVEAPGEGAFYGPKLEFTLIDALGRGWQCGTIQLDYQMPSAERLDAEYVGEDGARHHPVMLHRAILGSLERFIGILIEHFAGAFPLWLAPTQAVVVSVGESFNGYALKVAEDLKKSGFRAEADLRDQKMGAKIRDAQLRKVPYMLVVGAQEEAAGTVSLRTRTGEQSNGLPFAEFVAQLTAKVSAKQML